MAKIDGFGCADIYQLTGLFPDSEKYGLISQMRCCAVSIPSNIAEGSRRETETDFRRFILIAFGSGAELETQIMISKKLQYISDNDAKEVECILEEVMKMLNVLQKKLKGK